MGTLPRHHTNQLSWSSLSVRWLSTLFFCLNLSNHHFCQLRPHCWSSIYHLLIPVGQINTLLLNSPLLLVKVSSPAKLNNLGELNPGKPTMWDPPLISWSAPPMNTLVVVRIGIINHGDWSDVAPNLLILFGAHIVIRIIFQPTSLQSGAPKIAFSWWTWLQVHVWVHASYN